MFAIIAAAVFGLGLILDWANVKTSDAFTPATLMMAGLFCLALHLAGVGTATTWRSNWRNNWRTRVRR